ncbi:MAG: TetR/AcrR family transcriptional regulator [Devosiaceae bacterium]|nr:TetR/AcrR family transcriptional regulator [Devosiaceae bacterium MH13]
MLSSDQTDAVIDSFLALLMTRSMGSIAMREIATGADVPLADVLLTFSSKLDVLEAFAARIDAQVLAEDDPDMASEPARERLFDVLMRRYDALLPHKLALIQLERDIRSDPALGLQIARIAGRSMERMAASADVDVDGPRGALVMAGLLRLHRTVLRAFLAEEDGGQAKTMAALDTGLRQAERRIGDLDRVMTMMTGQGGPSGGPLCRLRAAMDRRRGRNADASDEPAEPAEAA